MFSLNATLPVFLTMIAGYLLHKVGFITKEFCDASDKLVFKVTLPLMMVMDFAKADLRHEFDVNYVLFCAIVTTIAFFGIWGIARLFIRDKSILAEFVQASYRSSAAILGAAFILNIYGTTGMTSLMILGAVPLFNVYAVLILSVENKDQGIIQIESKDGNKIENKKENRKRIRKKKIQETLIEIMKNPIIDGIALGVLISLLPISLPTVVNKTISNLTSLTTPLALLSIGATFQGRKAISKIKLTMVASLFKLLILTGVFLPVAIYMGFRDEMLVALLIMLGSPTTPTCYIMAKNMGHEGVLSSSCVVMTTVLSAITITLWIFIFRSLGYM